VSIHAFMCPQPLDEGLEQLCDRLQGPSRMRQAIASVVFEKPVQRGVVLGLMTGPTTHSCSPAIVGGAGRGTEEARERGSSRHEDRGSSRMVRRLLSGHIDQLPQATHRHERLTMIARPEFLSRRPERCLRHWWARPLTVTFAAGGPSKYRTGGSS